MRTFPYLRVADFRPGDPEGRLQRLLQGTASSRQPTEFCVGSDWRRYRLGRCERLQGILHRCAPFRAANQGLTNGRSGWRGGGAQDAGYAVWRLGPRKEAAQSAKNWPGGTSRALSGDVAGQRA